MAKVTVIVETSEYSVPALKAIVVGCLSDIVLHHPEMKVEIKGGDENNGRY